MKQAVSEAHIVRKCGIIIFNFFHMFVHSKIVKLICKITFSLDTCFLVQGPLVFGNHIPFWDTLIPCEKVASVTNCYIQNLSVKRILVHIFDS
jgi:hypothetical protein